MIEDFLIFKQLEKETDARIDAGSIAVMRLDGSNFSTFTKQFEKPFSLPFEEAMNASAQAILEHVLPNALICYVGSDEISLVISSNRSQLPYGGRVTKLLTLAAAHATAGFMNAIGPVRGVPAFDARLIQFTDATLIREYITWRRLDVRKNATSMAAGALRSHKELMNVSTKERGELLVGTAFEVIPEGTFNGRFVTKNSAVPAERDLAERLTAAAADIHTAGA